MLDDNSSDDTPNIVKRLGAADNRTCLISGKALCEGWVGKPFACYQLAQKAKGDWLLFVDADTVHAPHMLRSTMSMAINPGALCSPAFPAS